MSYTMTLDIPERTTEFVRKRESQLRPALNAIVVAFVATQMQYEDSLARGNGLASKSGVESVMAAFEKLAVATSARRSKPYVFNRADAYAETLT